MSGIPPSSEREQSIFELLTPLVRRWRLSAGLPLACGIAVAALSFLIPATYTASTTFTPDVGVNNPASVLGGLANLAGQFGLPGLAGSNSSPEFFAAVLKSRELLKATLLWRFRNRLSTPPDSTLRLIDLLGVNGSTETERLNIGLRLLDKLVSTHIDKRTNIVTLSFEGRPAGLAADVANQMVALLNQFNLESRQTQSREQRRLIGARLAEAERELHGAETEHLRFLQKNRRYQDSPLLTFEANRLERQIQLRQEIYTTLSREYEEARIAEVRDTPVLTIIDPAVPPDKKSHPKRRLIVFLAMLVGGAGAASLAYLGEFKRAVKGRRRDVQDFSDAWNQASGEMRQLLTRRVSR